MSSSPPEVTTVRCAYPGCENEPRAAEDVVGAKPKYCEQPDRVTGKPHSALTAFRRRQELSRQGGPAEAEDLGRPVTMATARAAELRKGIRADMAALTGKLADLAAQLDRAADPEAAAAQVEAVQAEAAEQVDGARAETAREALRRQQADAAAEEARTAAVEMDERLQAADAARAEAEQASAVAAREVEQLRGAHAAELDRIREETQARITIAEEDRDSAIARAEADKAEGIAAAEQRASRAQAQAQEAIDQMRAEAETLVRTAGDARDQAARAGRAS